VTKYDGKECRFRLGRVMDGSRLLGVQALACFLLTARLSVDTKHRNPNPA